MIINSLLTYYIKNPFLLINTLIKSNSFLGSIPFLTVLKGPFTILLITAYLIFLFVVCFFKPACCASVSILLLQFVFSNYFLLVRDLVRETAKKCCLVPLGVFTFGFLLFVLSESILFVSIFWASFHFNSSPFFSFQEVLFIPDPCELTYGNTLLLSNAAVSLGCTIKSLFGSPHFASLSGVLAWTFLSLQIKEFRNLGFYVSDSVYGCVFFSISGLHFFHVVVGLVIIGMQTSFPEACVGLYIYTPQDLYFTIQVLYWHFVEVVWLFLFCIFL